MTYHFVVGDMAAEPLRKAVSMEPALIGTVIALKDLLHLGPLKKQEEQSFKQMRGAFWQQVSGEKTEVEVPDMERLLKVSGEMFKDNNINVWFWMAPSAADLCAYYWLLPYLSKHIGRFFIVNIAGLPFLDEQGKLFYPQNISSILPRELVKAQRLARAITPSEMEVDKEEWEKLVSANAPLRVYEQGKKLSSQSETFYDNQLLSLCMESFQKASKIVRQAILKFAIPTGDIWLGWRLKMLVASGVLVAQGNIDRPLNEFDLRLLGESITMANDADLQQEHIVQ
ncbi:MAG: DUF1835 domain-containing protein [Bacteroidetes bacterium]|nr:DUF1835 domain-containing protein [Bacteroidota bacterium]MBS1739695.1 DUF1835 domain-containing protein [Bacteroidota bacterium]